MFNLRKEAANMLVHVTALAYGFIPCLASGQAIQTPTTPQPTPAQAAAFVSQTVAQYGLGTCNGGAYAQVSEQELAKIEGNTLIVQNNRQGSDTTGAMEKMNDIETLIVPLDNVKITIDQQRYGYCNEYLVVVTLSCKNNATCMRMITDWNETDTVNPPRVTKDRTAISEGCIGVTDSAMATRLLRALQFYQSHLPPAAVSPF